MSEAKIGIMGGSGLYRMEGMTGAERVRVSTPFGDPSDSIILGDIEGVRVAFLPRHGEGHRIAPGELPARANIYALKSLGVERIISVGAVGSLKEGIAPTDVVVPDQFIDRTRGRDSSFFTDGIVAHVSMAEPFCPVLSRTAFEVGTGAGARVHGGGTYLVMEGPQLSTRAESELYRFWGADIIGMTASPEAKLAREAEICYAMLALVTDYDCWHMDHESVTTEMILGNLRKTVHTVQTIIRLLIPAIPHDRDCGCASALEHAIATDREAISDEKKKELELLIGRYMRGK